LEASDALSFGNTVFDESGNFLIYGSLVGIKILNLVTNRVVRVLGAAEAGERFLFVALYQGTPKVDTQFLLAKAGAEGAQQKTADQLHKAPVPDPTVYCTSFKKRRFYCFSTRAPDESKESRDVLNEMPTEEERAAVVEAVPKGLGKEAILRTSLGDIHIKLFHSECPRTVENFSTHAKNGYYDNVIFHRVIKGFMVQTGDPQGDGTGGESIWGGEFDDEFVRTLRHDRPFTVSMANSGPNTNGSQFFITTVPTPWLDNKHTVFGRVTKGFDVVTKIENARTNKYDKPVEVDIKILGVEIIS
jgi:peptidylprolyl isomerase domain and WD repeat-containing protein 1